MRKLVIKLYEDEEFIDEVVIEDEDVLKNLADAIGDENAEWGYEVLDKITNLLRV